MKIFALPVAVAAHITLSAAYVATVYTGSACNAANPQFPAFSVVGFNLSGTRTSCIAPSVPLDAGSFSLTGCATGGSAAIFSDTACIKALTTIDGPAGTACAESLAVGSFIIAGC